MLLKITVFGSVILFFLIIDVYGRGAGGIGGGGILRPVIFGQPFDLLGGQNYGANYGLNGWNYGTNGYTYGNNGWFLGNDGSWNYGRK